MDHAEPSVQFAAGNAALCMSPNRPFNASMDDVEPSVQFAAGNAALCMSPNNYQYFSIDSQELNGKNINFGNQDNQSLLAFNFYVTNFNFEAEKTSETGTQRFIKTKGMIDNLLAMFEKYTSWEKIPEEVR